MVRVSRANQVSLSLLYHVINRGNARCEIYHDQEDCQRFVDILISYSFKRELKIYHWVLMPNHYHLVLELETPKNLSSIMAGIGRSYVHYHHRKYNSAGHLFQDRFKSQAIEKERYLVACGRYIERNPVKAGIVDTADNHRFSSAAFYARGKNDGLTFESPYYNNFGRDAKERQDKYRVFLTEFDQEEETTFNNFEMPQGSQEFIRRLIKDRGYFQPRNGRPRIKKFIRNPIYMR